METKTRDFQDGLAWRQTLLGAEPQWTREPDMAVIERIVRKFLGIDGAERCQVSKFASGAFNKLYSVRCPGHRLLLRVSLPVCPRRKTISEVATILLLEAETHIPVPYILASDSTNQNELGFEYILMREADGVPLRRRWRNMTMDSKKRLVRTIAQAQAEMVNCSSTRFEVIGNIYLPPKRAKFTRLEPTSLISWETQPEDNDCVWAQADRSGDGKLCTEDGSSMDELDLLTSINSSPGPVVSMEFFWENRVRSRVSHGPFQTAHDWLQAELMLILEDQEEILLKSVDVDEREDACAIKHLATTLQRLLPEFFHMDEDAPEQTALLHTDLNDRNILVDKEGRLEVIVDWECVPALPLWMATEVPEFLDGANRNEEPVRDDYSNESDKNEEPVRSEAIDEEPDNEGKNPLYWEHLLEYEQTQLRPIYLEELKRLWPEYDEVREKGAAAAEFEMAVRSCNDLFGMKSVKEWLDDREKGNHWSLKERY